VLDRSLWLKNLKLGFIAVTVITLTGDERKIGFGRLGHWLRSLSAKNRFAGQANWA
jgi:hypothetical protein